MRFTISFDTIKEPMELTLSGGFIVFPKARIGLPPMRAFLYLFIMITPVPNFAYIDNIQRISNGNGG